jgi:hypothetical protein
MLYWLVDCIVDNFINKNEIIIEYNNFNYDIMVVNNNNINGSNNVHINYYKKKIFLTIVNEMWFIVFF